MDSFLIISRLFNESAERTVHKLSSIYGLEKKLSDLFTAIIRTRLEEDNFKGKRILIKPNWVNHSGRSTDEICLRTSDDFIISALNVILDMHPSSVIIGDAPIQGCKWDVMLSDIFLERINKLSQLYNTPVLVKDFRRRTFNVNENRPESNLKPLSDYLIFDLAGESMLEPVTVSGKTTFRVTNYNPDRMTTAHSPGVHKYCIIKEFFEADLVISLPKIKTHQKTGITGALKNIVGINGDKDFLPHHRIGGIKMGGDCYPGGAYLRYWAELSLDMANRQQGKKDFWVWRKLSSFFWKLSLPGPEYNLSAGWYGNDTTWRMVADLNKIAVFGKADGTLSDDPQREIYSLCDGIIAGQGDGPLAPDPLPLGIISFTNDSLLNDKAMATLMGLPIGKIPLLNHKSYENESDSEIILDGKSIGLSHLRQLAVNTVPPPGWANYLKK